MFNVFFSWAGIVDFACFLFNFRSGNAFPQNPRDNCLVILNFNSLFFFFFFFFFNDDSKFLVYFIKCRKLDGLFLVWITILLTSIIFLFAIFLKMVNNLEHEYSISLGLMECLKVPVYIRDSEHL